MRAYYFTRLNNPQLTLKNPLNQATFNAAISIHGGYDFHNGFSVGATYLYADPATATCDTPASHLAGTPCVKPNTGAALQGTNPDDTLPGFILNTLYEAYLQYKSPAFTMRLGDQVINTPWAPSSDTRLKPSAFQGGDFTYKFNSNWTAQASYMARFESRVSSDFLNSTLLTEQHPADAPGAGANLHIAPFSQINTPGFGYARIGYTGGPLVVNLHDYYFVDIANAIWLDAIYTWKTYLKPTLAIQGGYQWDTGKSVIGKVNSQVFGVQGSITPWKNVTLTGAYNDIPLKTTTVTLTPGVLTCTAGAIGGSSVFPYFLPTGGTPQCLNNGNGTATVYYGGWPSPYSDSYATDPLFTTSISQGMIDRRSPGQAAKVGLTVYLDNKRIRLITNYAWYIYGTNEGGLANTQEYDADATYYFNPVGIGTYHGLSLRHRYAERTQQFFTTNPDFKYNRTQLEYDF